MPIEEYPEIPLSREQSWHFKVTRADEHLQAVDIAIKWFTQTGPYEAVTQHDTDTDRNRIVVKAVHPVPLQIRLAVGDCVGNFRAALDHMWAGVLHNFALPITTRTQFPIFDRDPNDAKSRRIWTSRLGGVPPDVEAVLKPLQPYYGGDAANHPLYHLNEIVRYDKHNALSLMVVRSSGPELRGSEGTIKWDARERLEPGTVLADIGPEVQLGGFDPGMGMGFHGMVEIGFDQPPAVARREVVATLRAIRDQVADVFWKFLPFYAARPPDG